jgi:hypothetical protein
MSHTSLHQEAECCRQQALAYLGRPEGSFLLRVAREFDRLAQERQRPQRHDRATSTPS